VWAISCSASLRLHVAAQGGLHLRLEHGQRRAQLVRAVAHEAFLVLEQLRQPGHVQVGALDQRRDLARCLCGVDRAQVVLGASGQLGAQRAHRLRHAVHHHRHHDRDHQHQTGLAPERVDQDLARQRLAQLQRLGHLYRRHALPIRAADGLQQDRDPHRQALVVVIVEMDQRGIGAAIRQAATPRSQTREAGDHLAREAADAVEQAAAVVGLEGLQRRIGESGSHARVCGPAFHAELLAQRLGGGQQGTVVGGVGRGQRLAVEHHGVDEHKGAYRQQDAQQQRATQRRRAPHHALALMR